MESGLRCCLVAAARPCRAGVPTQSPAADAEDELARLELQGRALAPATGLIFAAAGIRPGMQVLDLGCGACDVAFVAADLVGPDGHVVGVDRSPEALARARLRAEQRGLAQVRFVEGDIQDPAPGGPFDAIVGRLVLMYVPDPATVLRRQATVLRWRRCRANRVRSSHRPDAASDSACEPGKSLAGRSVRQGRDRALAGRTAVGHSPGGGAAPAGDDRDPAAFRTRRSGCCRPDSRGHPRPPRQRSRLEYARHGRSLGGEGPLEEEVMLTPGRRQLRRREAGWEGSPRRIPAPRNTNRV